MPKVSIIVPFYNSEEYIRKTLENILSQSVSDFEVLCIDDGSTDLSAEIVHEIQKRDTRVRYLRQDNKGSGAARNNGLKHATGKYIAFMDSDDEYPRNDALELLYNKAEEKNVVICGGSLWNPRSDTSEDLFQEEGIYSFRDNQYHYGYSRFIYRREFLAENNCWFPEYRVYQDPVFLLKAMSAAKEYYAITEYVYQYNTPHGPTRTYSLQRFKDYFCGILDSLNISTRENYKEVFNKNMDMLRFSFLPEAKKCIQEGRADRDFFEMIFELSSFFGIVEGLTLRNELEYSFHGNQFLYRFGQLGVLMVRLSLKLFVKIPNTIYQSRTTNKEK